VWISPRTRSSSVSSRPGHAAGAVAGRQAVRGTAADKTVRVWKTADAKESLKLPSAGRALGFLAGQQAPGDGGRGQHRGVEVETANRRGPRRASSARTRTRAGVRLVGGRQAGGVERGRQDHVADAADARCCGAGARSRGRGAVARWRPAGAGLRGRYALVWKLSSHEPASVRRRYDFVLD